MRIRHDEKGEQDREPCGGWEAQPAPQRRYEEGEENSPERVSARKGVAERR